MAKRDVRLLSTNLPIQLAFAVTLLFIEAVHGDTCQGINNRRFYFVTTIHFVSVCKCADDGESVLGVVKRFTVTPRHAQIYN